MTSYTHGRHIAIPEKSVFRLISLHSTSNPIGRFLKKITVPVLVMHGDGDQIAPYANSARLSAQLLRNSTLKTYKGFPHGMPTTQADTINADLLAFIKG